MEEALLCDRVAVLRRGELLADDSPINILKAGRTRLAVRQGDQVGEHDIATTPEALAAELQAYGLSAEVEAVLVEPDSLEDVIVALIRSRGEP